MNPDRDASLKTWLLEALAAFCPVNVARVVTAWLDAAPAPIEIETPREHGRHRRE